MAQNGITYFKYDKNLYNGDETKGCSLNGGEIDNNFYFLRGMDIVGGYFDENMKLHLITLADDDIEISGNTFSISGESIDFSGTTYDGENGILDIWVNGENVASLSGFTVCDCEALMNEIEEIKCYIENNDMVISGLTESFEQFKKSLDDVTIGGEINTKTILSAIATLTDKVAKDEDKIQQNSENISNLQRKGNELSSSLEKRKEEINALSASIEKETDERKASDEEITNKINSLGTSVNEKIEEDSKVIASVKQELTEHSESNEKEFKEMHNLIDANKDSVADIKKSLDNEIERAETTETELSNNIESVKTEINTSVKDRLDHQQQDIDNINANVNETLAFATSALTEVSKHTISDISLDEDDNLKLIFKDPNHFMETSLKKYNYSADEKTLHKDGQSFSAITDKDGGVVSWKTFNEHIQKYNDLLNKYNALQQEFNDYKNADVYYIGIVSENDIDIENNINIDIILQHKYIVDFNTEKKACTYICNEGNYLMYAIPHGKTANLYDEMNIKLNLSKISTERNYQGKEYDIYSSENMPFASGSRYQLIINE